MDYVDFVDFDFEQCQFGRGFRGFRLSGSGFSSVGGFRYLGMRISHIKWISWIS